MTQKKLAIFVEGQTEQIFLHRLLTEIAGRKNIHFVCKTLRGGVLGQSLWLKQETVESDVASYSVLLVDCMGDEGVKSTVLDQRESLSKAGYDLLLGLRDLYPLPTGDFAKIQSRMAYGIPTKGLPTHIILAVPEVEAWFLQEYNHYPNIHKDLDCKDFDHLFGFDPVDDSAEDVECAAELLDRIYSTVGFRYKKSRNHVQRTIDALSYEDIYVTCPPKVPQLGQFIRHIEEFLV